MLTMSHSPAERKLWHAGKRKKDESSFRAFLRSARSGFKGACTPNSIRGGIYYKSRKAGEA